MVPVRWCQAKRRITYRCTTMSILHLSRTQNGLHKIGGRCSGPPLQPPTPFLSDDARHSAAKQPVQCSSLTRLPLSGRFCRRKAQYRPVFKGQLSVFTCPVRKVGVVRPFGPLAAVPTSPGPSSRFFRGGLPGGGSRRGGRLRGGRAARSCAACGGWPRSPAGNCIFMLFRLLYSYCQPAQDKHP